MIVFVGYTGGTQEQQTQKTKRLPSNLELSRINWHGENHIERRNIINTGTPSKMVMFLEL